MWSTFSPPTAISLIGLVNLLNIHNKTFLSFKVITYFLYYLFSSSWALEYCLLSRSQSQWDWGSCWFLLLDPKDQICEWYTKGTQQNLYEFTEVVSLIQLWAKALLFLFDFWRCYFKIHNHWILEPNQGKMT